MAVHEEQEAFLKSYADEKEPNTKMEKEEAKMEHEVLVAEGVPLHSPVVAAGMAGSATPWSTSLCACLGSNDEFLSSDLEVCMLGTCAPCCLSASNAEWLNPTREKMFTGHLLCYSMLYALGSIMFGYNALAPCFSCSVRTDMRKKYNLMGTSECFAKSCGCGPCYAESSNHEAMDAVGDFVLHYLCHPCALCQEGREIRRRRPPPGFIRRYIPMMAPTEQVME